MNFKNFYFQKLDEISMAATQTKIDNVFEYDPAMDKVKVYSLELPHYFSQFGIIIDDNYMSTLKKAEDASENKNADFNTIILSVKSQIYNAQITDRQIQLLKDSLKQMNVKSIGELEPWQKQPSLDNYIVDIGNSGIKDNILTIIFNKEIILYRSKNL
jgi:hypothetical protein